MLSDYIYTHTLYVFSSASKIGQRSVYFVMEFILLYLFVIPSAVMAASSPCRQGFSCKLPDCFCSTFEHPTMNRSDIPQMVYFAFDDAVNIMVASHYNYLFVRNLTNPNGCPIGITLFISDHYTDYSILQDYYKRGFELAVHSVTHSHINSGYKVRKEADEQRHNIMTRVGVPKDEIVGWRSPFLVTAGDEQIDALKQLGFTYDISLDYSRQKMDDDDAWPFTLDYGWPYKCNSKCPKQSHKGFWQVPINAIRDYQDKYSCSFVDGCHNYPNTEEKAYKLIMDNFYSHYNGNRAPFGLHMHAAWFKEHTRAAMARALHDMLSHNDVYIITVKQVIEWMKNPTPISDVNNFEGWGCWGRENTKSELVLLALQISFVLISTGCITYITIRKMCKKGKNRKYADIEETIIHRGEIS